MKILSFGTKIRCTGIAYADFGPKSAAQASHMLLLACQNIEKSLLGVFGSILGVFGVPLGSLWGTFGSLWGYFGVTLAVLGPLWGPL